MLSIIIPALNEEKYLPILLSQIKKQNFSGGKYEIIVADAGSKDKTVEIAKSYGCKVVPGGLPPKARNEGAKKARGELFLFLDADVVLPENSLEKFLKEFYLWGAEWWYWMKEKQNKPEIWDEAKKLFIQ